MSYKQKWMNLAIKAAKYNPIKGLPQVAAVLITQERGPVIGLNQRKSHPLQAKFGVRPGLPCIHAEIAAIVKASDLWLDDAEMYIARILKDGTPALAKPCPGCQMAIQAFDIKEVYWTE